MKRGGVMRRREWIRFVQEEDGIGTVEIILILVVIVGLIVIFKSQLTTLINNAFSTITSQADSL